MRSPVFRSGIAAALLASLSLGACSNADERDSAAQPASAVPMPSADDANQPIALNFSFLQAAFSLGDVGNFARSFIDSATMYVPQYGRMVGRATIVREFGGEGLRLRVKEIQRISDGRYVDGRDVVDSGRYAIVTAAPLPPNTLDVEGRYWTRWRHLDDGTWLIVSDSIVGTR
jgi:hypothetical protein